MTKGQLIFAILALILVVTAVPSVLAFEGYSVNVKAQETIPATKAVRLATVEEISLANSFGAGIPSGGNPAGVTQWDSIPSQTCIAWVVTIGLMNPLDYQMNGVMVYDQFNEHVGIAVISASQGMVNIAPPNQLAGWNVGSLAPGADACLSLIVWTRCEEGDLACQQQFAAAGVYDLNYSGIIMTWYDSQAVAQSYLCGGPPLTVTVYDPLAAP
ncbi:MAG: hypothetical protein JW967_04520 [Dehalococcoidales bacterium]|nr:hypothetical protein [Dehalococcoidales bacterium]